MENEFIKNLLEALDDKRINEKIINIIEVNKSFKKSRLFEKNTEKEEKEIKKLKESLENVKKDNKSLEDLINQYKRKLESAKNDLMQVNAEKNKVILLTRQNEEISYELKNKYNELERKNNEINILKINNKHLSDEIKKAKEVKNYYENSFEQLLNTYRKYNELSIMIKQELNSVIKFDTAELFLASGVQWENIEALWQFISYKISEYDKSDINVLIESFEYFFNKYNEIHNLYELLKVHIGDEFDEDLHIRGCNSRVSGKISEIVLFGYKNIRTDKIVQKSIVRV